MKLFFVFSLFALFWGGRVVSGDVPGNSAGLTVVPICVSPLLGSDAPLTDPLVTTYQGTRSSYTFATISAAISFAVNVGKTSATLFVLVLRNNETFWMNQAAPEMLSTPSTVHFMSADRMYRRNLDYCAQFGAPNTAQANVSRAGAAPRLRCATSVTNSVFRVRSSSFFDWDGIDVMGCSAPGSGQDGGALFFDRTRLSAGLTIRNSKFSYNLAIDNGGAVYAGALGPILIEHCTFENNAAQTTAGALKIRKANAIVRKCQFNHNGYLQEIAALNFSNPALRGLSNPYTENGGSVSISACAAAGDPYVQIFQECTFNDGRTFYGAGHLVQDECTDAEPVSPVTVIDACSFVLGRTDSYGGCVRSYADLIVRNSLFDRCVTAGDGGGIWVGRNAATRSTPVTGVRISGSAFSRCEAAEGGGIRFSTFSSGIEDRFLFRIADSKFEENSVSLTGGGVSLRKHDNVQIARCLFSSNFANTTAAYGGGLFVRESKVSLEQNLFLWNTATNNEAQAIECRGLGKITWLNSTVVGSGSLQIMARSETNVPDCSSCNFTSTTWPVSSQLCGSCDRSQGFCTACGSTNASCNTDLVGQYRFPSSEFVPILGCPCQGPSLDTCLPQLPFNFSNLVLSGTSCSSGTQTSSTSASSTAGTSPTSGLSATSISATSSISSTPATSVTSGTSSANSVASSTEAFSTASTSSSAQGTTSQPGTSGAAPGTTGTVTTGNSLGSTTTLTTGNSLSSPSTSSIPTSSFAADKADESTSQDGGSDVLIIVLVMLAVALCLCVVCAFLLWKRRQRLAEATSSGISMSGSVEESLSVEAQPSTPGGYVAMSNSPMGKSDYLDDVTVDKEIGKGQFGLVYLGSWNGNLVALKVVTAVAKGSASANDTLEFENEVALLASFRHPHIVQLFGLARGENDEIFMVLEYCENGSVSEYLHRAMIKARVPVPTALKIKMMLQAASGIEYLHSRKTIHRDIACRNLLIDSAGTVRVSDMGMARITDEHDTYESGSKKKAIPVRWASAEQLSQGKTTPASDVYMFGVTIWECLSDAALPFTSLANSDVSEIVLAGETAKHLKMPRCLSQLSTCPIDYDVVEQCWDLDPDARPSISKVRSMLLGGYKAAAVTLEKKPATSDEDGTVLYSNLDSPMDFYAKTPGTVEGKVSGQYSLQQTPSATSPGEENEIADHKYETPEIESP